MDVQPHVTCAAGREKGNAPDLTGRAGALRKEGPPGVDLLADPWAQRGRGGTPRPNILKFDRPSNNPSGSAYFRFRIHAHPV
jgi:hypothetical protein